MASINTASSRSMLLSLGMGDFNATTVVPLMMIAPAQTDPQLTQSVLLVKHMQRLMQAMGASAVVTGTIDSNWQPFFEAVGGPNWPSVPWFDLARTLLEARGQGMKFAAAGGDGRAIALAGLPSVTDNLAMYAAGAVGLWYLFLRKR